MSVGGHNREEVVVVKKKKGSLFKTNQ